MAELMSRQSTQNPLVTLRKGENVSGVITKMTNSDIRVDVNSKTHAMVLEKDRKIFQSLMKAFKVGDTVQVSVLSPESEQGYPVVSLRRHIDEFLWKDADKYLKSHEAVEGAVEEATRGGYVIDLPFGISGFLPNSQLLPSTPRAESTEGGTRIPSPLIGTKLTVYVIESGRAAKKLIVSQKSPITTDDFTGITKDFKVGQKISATVSNSASFGVFVTIQLKENKFIDGLVHVSELGWDEKDQDPMAYTAGQPVQCLITGFDRESQRIELSMKKLTADPFQELLKGVEIDQNVSGVVTKVDDSGVTVDVEVNGNTVEGFIKKEKIPPTVTYVVDQEISATVSQIDTKRHKLQLVPVLLRKTVGYR